MSVLVDGSCDAPDDNGTIVIVVIVVPPPPTTVAVVGDIALVVGEVDVDDAVVAGRCVHERSKQLQTLDEH